MRIALLSFYYPPDLSAGSFRMDALVRALLAHVPSTIQLEVLTTLPNRYHTYARQAAEVEKHEGLEIYRFALPAHRSDMVGQARAFLAFMRRVTRHVADRRYDIIFATSSRLMTAALGSWVARRQHAPLYLDIRDIFVDTIKEVLPRGAAWPAQHLFGAIEAWTMRRADRINLVSPGFEDYFRARYPDRPLAAFTNGIDDEFLPAAGTPERHRDGGLPLVLYAGNIGEGQSLHRILPDLARALSGRARFVVIGDGGRRAALAAALEQARVENVELRAPVPRQELLDLYRAADVLFLHLGAHAAFEKVLPSKLFEYAALGKPILAGVGGYAAQFTRAEISNSAVFSPCDTSAAVAAFETLELTDRPRPGFVAKYTRAAIAAQMAADIVSLSTRELRR